MIFSVTISKAQFALCINQLVPAERLQRRNHRVRLLSERRGHHTCIGGLTDTPRLPAGSYVSFNLGKIMEWLSQNWIWLVFGGAMFFMMRRGGGCCGGGHDADHKSPEADGSQLKSGSTGDCCGGAKGADKKLAEAEGSKTMKTAASAEHQH
ncbi:MAG: hypothetical protein JJD98_05670 [Polaromonas sp.]|nr:hypothetical protein [Polaromonas sp.]